MFINQVLSTTNNFDFSNFGVGNWVDLGISLTMCILLCVALVFIYKKRSLKIFFGIAFPILAVLIIFDLNFSALALGLVIAAVIIITAVTHLSDYKEFFNVSFKFLKRRKKKGKKGSSPDYDETKLYNNVREAVEFLARNKTGALITFEREDVINIPSDSVILNAPFVPELVETIFFPNTRLHDLGMIVRGDTIYAASVRYPLTTQVFSGKIGSRHRAAIGMSETNDSVTVVVSEETGRIHIARNGKLTPCTIHDFLDTFSNFMREGRKED